MNFDNINNSRVIFIQKIAYSYHKIWSGVDLKISVEM